MYMPPRPRMTYSSCPLRTNKLRRHPALVVIGEPECHALWSAFKSTRDEFIASVRSVVGPDVARRFGEGFRHVLKEEFLPNTKWGTLYRELIRLGLAALPKDGALPCGCEAREHERILKNLAGLLDPLQFRN